jgi:hypothetical protein
MFLDQLYKLFIGISVKEVLSYLVSRDLSVNKWLSASCLTRFDILLAGTRASTSWVNHPSVSPVG